MMTFLVGLTLLGFILNILLIKDFIPLLKLDRFVQGLTEDIDSKNKLIMYMLDVSPKSSGTGWHLWLNGEITQFKHFIVNNTYHAAGRTLESSLYEYACSLFAKLNNLFNKMLFLSLLNGALVVSGVIALGVNKPNELSESAIYLISILFFIICLGFYRIVTSLLYDYSASPNSKRGATLAQTAYSYIYKVLGELDPYTMAHRMWSDDGFKLFSKLDPDAHLAFKDYTPFMLSGGYNINNDYIYEIESMQRMLMSLGEVINLESDNMGNYAHITMNIQVGGSFHEFEDHELVAPRLKFLDLNGDIKYELDFYLNPEKMNTYTCKFKLGISNLEEYSANGCLVLSAYTLDNDFNIKIVRKDSNSDKPFQFKESISQLGELYVDVLP